MPGDTALLIAGIGVGLVLVTFTVSGLMVGTDVSTNSIFAVLSLVTRFPAVALWLTRNRYWRGLAVGLTAVWLLLAVAQSFDLLLPDSRPDDYVTGVAQISDAWQTPR